MSTKQCATRPQAFQLGEEVTIKTERGYTGTVLAIEGFPCKPDGPERRYLLDCHPGAVGRYVWIKIRNNNDYGKNTLYAANWFRESELEKLSKPQAKKKKGQP